MGGSLQRIEVLLIGLAVLIAGAVVAVLTVVRPLVLSSSAQPGQATVAAISASTALPVLTPVHTTPTLSTATATPAPTLATPGGHVDRASLPVLPARLWPLLVLATGCLGLPLVVLRARRRRMPYTNQSIGQLLATADATTRAANVRVMRELAAQGVLGADLAAAAGINLRRSPWPSVRCPHIRWPKIDLPTLRWPSLRIPPSVWLHWRTINWQRLVRHARGNELASSIPIAQNALAAKPAINHDSGFGAPDQPSELGSAPASTLMDQPTASSWTAEDRVLVTATALAELWTELRLRSNVLAYDTPRTAGATSVLVTIDPHPDEEQSIAELPHLLIARHPGWRGSWRHNFLEIVAVAHDVPHVGGPLLAPVLTHGRSGGMTRFIPLASWPHIGIYGGSASEALHAILGSLLYTLSPSDIALATMDQGQLTPLYRDVMHLVPLPDTPHATIELLTQLIRRSTWNAVRRLVLVVVEPDDAQLQLLIRLLARLQTRPDAPMHLIVVQEQPRNAGHELYALLPALITSGGQGSAGLLPGQNSWPKPGTARLFARGMRIEGRPILLDEGATAAQFTPLRGVVADRSPVLWDESAPKIQAETPSQDSHDPTPMVATVDTEGAEDTLSDQKRRIVAAITHRRQILLAREEATTHVAATVSVPMADDADATACPPPMSAQRAAQALTPEVSGADHSLEAADMPAIPEVAAQSRRASLFRATLQAGDMNTPSMLAYVPSPSSGAADESSLDHPHISPLDEPDNGWPAGPAPLGRIALAELMARMVSAPTIVTGPANELGVTKNRLAELVKGAEKGQAKALAEALLAWLDLADLLVAPNKPGRLRHPRALITTDLREIASRLAATPCPDQHTVAALWAESDEGRA